MLRRGLLALAALLLLAGAAQADTLVVAACGTLPLAYTPGDVRPDTEDVNGNKCITGNISASAVTAATAAAASSFFFIFAIACIIRKIKNAMIRKSKMV